MACFVAYVLFVLGGVGLCGYLFKTREYSRVIAVRT